MYNINRLSVHQTITFFFSCALIKMDDEFLCKYLVLDGKTKERKIIITTVYLILNCFLIYEKKREIFQISDV